MAVQRAILKNKDLTILKSKDVVDIIKEMPQNETLKYLFWKVIHVEPFQRKKNLPELKVIGISLIRSFSKSKSGIRKLFSTCTLYSVQCTLYSVCTLYRV